MKERQSKPAGTLKPPLKWAGGKRRMPHVIGLYHLCQECGLGILHEPDAQCPLCAPQKGKSLLNPSEIPKSRKNVLERFPATEIGGYCDECGTPYPPGRRGKSRRFCSPKCRKQSWTSRRGSIS